MRTTQICFKKEFFANLNVHDIAMFSFELNDEIVGPKMNDKQYHDFMIVNPKLCLNNMGELIHNEFGIVAIALEFKTFK